MPCLNRRKFLFAAGSGGAALRGVTASSQSASRPWQAGDGIRLAGPFSGPLSLDPAISRESQTNAILLQLFRGLVSFDTNLSPVPELASQIDVSANGLEYQFTVRPEAQFHNGRKVTPADVVSSITRALNPKTTNGDPTLLAASEFLHDIEGADRLLAGESSTLAGVDITGDATVSIVLSRPSPAFLAKLASIPTAIVDTIQIADNPAWDLAPNGTGPYRFDSWAPGESIALQPADSWWGGKPTSGVLTYRLGANAVLPVNLFQAGNIDLVWSVPPEMVDLVADPGSGFSWGQLTRVELFSTMYIAFTNQSPPLDDLHVRRAIQLAFPAENVARLMFQGTVIAASGIVPPGMNGRAWNVTVPDMSIDAARKELESSRYGTPEETPPIRVYAADIGPVEALRDSVHHATGLTIEAISVPWPDFIDGFATRRYPAYAINWTADFPDATSMLEMLFHTLGSGNGSGYSNPDFDALLDEARSASPDTRLAILDAANQLLIDDAAVLPLYHDVGHALIRQGLGGVRITPIGLLGLETVRTSE